MFTQMTKESFKESIEKYFGGIPDNGVVTRSHHKLTEKAFFLLLLDLFEGNLNDNFSTAIDFTNDIYLTV